MKKAMIIMDKQMVNRVYPEAIMDEIKTLVDLVGEPMSLEEVSVDFSVLQM